MELSIKNIERFKYMLIFPETKADLEKGRVIKMEITIKAKCPNCSENIIISSQSEQKNDEKQKTLDNLYPMKSLTLTEAAEKPGFFEDIFDYAKKDNVLDHIKDYFYTLKSRIEFTNDRKELLEIQKSLSKLKAKVSDKVIEEIENNKKAAIDLVKKKIKQINESEKKSKRKNYPEKRK